MTCFAALRREVVAITAIPILVNGRTWWTDRERTRVAPTKHELFARLATLNYTTHPRRKS
jgi:hypothetical protein